MNQDTQAKKRKVKDPMEYAESAPIAAWMTFVVSLYFVPILFGAITFILGYITRSKYKKDIHGVVLMVAGVVGAILGTYFALIEFRIF